MNSGEVKIRDIVRFDYNGEVLGKAIQITIFTATDDFITVKVIESKNPKVLVNSELVVPSWLIQSIDES